MTAPPQRLLIVLWSCGPDRPGGAALVAAPLVYALAARALDVEVELHFAASTVRWLLDNAAAKATTDAAGSKTVLDFLVECRTAGVKMYACAMALAEHRRAGAVLRLEPDGIAGAATVVGATLEPGVRSLVF